MARYRSAIAILTCALAAMLSGLGCGTDATGTDTCRKIEQTRCRKAAGCPDLGLKGLVGVEECVQYARDRCLHGLAIADPGPPAVDACIHAIEQATTCEIVAKPDTAPECAFLRPPNSNVDGGSDASVDDATDLDGPGTNDGG